MAYRWNPVCMLFLSHCSLLIAGAAGSAIVLPDDSLQFSPRCWALDPLHEGDVTSASDILYADLYNVTITSFAFEFSPLGSTYYMNSMCFSGSRSSYALIAHSGQISAGGDFAWVLVVKPSCPCQGVIMEYESDASSYFLSVRQSNDNLKMDFKTPEITYKASFPGFSPLTSWKMFIISYSDSTGRFGIFYGDFPNGKLILKTLDMDFSSFNATGTVRLGSSKENTSVPFTGCLGCLAFFPWSVSSVNTAVQSLCNPAGAYSTVWTLHSERTRRPLTTCSSCTTAEQQTTSEMTSQTTVSASSSAQAGTDTTAAAPSADSTTTTEGQATPAATTTSLSAASLASTLAHPATSLAMTSAPDPMSTSDLSKKNDVRVVYNVSTHAQSSPAAVVAETLDPWLPSTEPPTVPAILLPQDTPPGFASVKPSSIPKSQCRPSVTQNPGSMLCACKQVDLPVAASARAPVTHSLLDLPSAELSAKRRKKGCAPDNRTSAVTLGVAGVFVVVAVVSTFVLHDVYRVVVYICSYASR